MKLLVDIGNSRIKWAFGVAGQFVAEGVGPGGVDGSLSALFDSRQTPDEIRIANVAGTDAGTRVAAILKEHFRIEPLFAGSIALGAGIRNGYSDPAQLGVDRWLALCAAFSRFKAPLCVVDAGTATTFDLVTASGEHKGGLILPGIALMQSALLRETGDLARLSARTNADMAGTLAEASFPGGEAGSPIELGRDTYTAIRYGAAQATAVLARQCMEALCAGLPAVGSPGVLVLTGGAAPALQADLLRLGEFLGPEPRQAYRLEHRHQLVLEGLALEPPCFAVAKLSVQP